ncbi:MAG: DHHA1 domain-containing protein, partial [Verrucomicrobiota bacterium]
VIKAVNIATDAVSKFVGYDNDEIDAEIVELVEGDDAVVAIVDKSPLYVEKGGQEGDTGTAIIGDEEIEILGTATIGEALCLQLAEKPNATEGAIKIQVNESRRRDIEKHHTATHIMHWALHEAVSKDATQQGSLVAEDRLRFDVSAEEALTDAQILEVEKLVNEKVADNDPVSWVETEHAGIKDREDIMQFFGDKYGDVVRVVQIGGKPEKLDGYSMELCGGTHVRETGEIGMFALRSQSPVGAGLRRIEALCGEHARAHLQEVSTAVGAEVEALQAEARDLAEKLESKEKIDVDLQLPNVGSAEANDMGDVLDQLATLRGQRDELKAKTVDFKKQLKKRLAKEQAAAADKILGDWVERAKGDTPAIVESLEGDGGLLQEALNGLKKRQFKGVAVLAIVDEGAGKVHLGVSVDKSLTGDFKAGELLQELAPIVDGRGGGKPEMARGAGADASKVGELLDAARGKFA